LIAARDIVSDYLAERGYHVFLLSLDCCRCTL